VNGIITRITELIQEQAKKNQVQIITQFDQNIPLITADEQKLEQVFLNIVINSIEATAAQKNKPGKLTIRTRGIENNGVGSVSNDAGTTAIVSGTNISNSDPVRINLIEISFEDNGPGIKPVNLDNIFTPFFTTKMRGTGLGLAVAQRIVKEHHGVILVNSKLTEQTRFVVQLPVENKAYTETQTVEYNESYSAA
jgi:signal transduction histidine kinase